MPSQPNDSTWLLVRYRAPNKSASTILAKRPGSATPLPTQVQYAGLPILLPEDARLGDETDFGLALQGAWGPEKSFAYFEQMAQPADGIKGIAFEGRMVVTPDLARRALERRITFDEFMRLAWQAGATDPGNFEVA